MRVVLLGAGNVATNLGCALQQAGHEVVQVWSHTRRSARTLAEKLSVACYTDRLEDVKGGGDIYIIAVVDSAVETVGRSVVALHPDAFVVHTGGSMPMDTLMAVHRGVFYPMQTFSKQRIVDFSHLPLFLEASTADDLKVLQQLAASLSDSVHVLDSDARKYLHLGAVFCCNFANHCSTLAAQILEKHHIPFSVMLPLLDETVRKLHVLPPAAAQTGPAIRHDMNVMHRQMDILKSEGEAHLLAVYRMLSESISHTSVD